MAGWKEQAKQNVLTKTASEVSGTRVFLWTPDGGATLPVIGDSWDGQEGDNLDQPLYVKQVDRSYAGDHYQIPQWTVQYSAVPRSEGTTPFADLVKTADIGGEMYASKPVEGALWEDHTPMPSDTPVFRRLVTMTIKIPKIFNTFESFAEKIVQNAGQVNSTSFLGMDAEKVLFMGGSTTEIRDSRGAKRWRADMTFEVRAPILLTGEYGNWQYLFNDEVGSWMRPKVDIYEKIDFNTTLFAISGL